VTPVSTETTTAPAQSRQHVVIQRVRRLGWGVADQGISSLSNFALGLFVARSFGASNFGAFTLAFITYTVVINASRGLATDPLLVRYSGKVTRRWRSATAAATGTALVVGVAVGVICILAGLLLPDPVGPVFIALGIGLPGLALQDSWRFAFFACGRGSAAFLNDLFWSVLLFGSLLVLHSWGDSSSQCLLAFGTTATLAALLGMVQARTLPRPFRGSEWLRDHGELSVRYLIENVSTSAASLLRSFLVGAIAGLASVGYVRASEILMGPFLVVLMGISQVAVPEASRVFHGNSGHLARFCFILGGVQAAAAIAWGLVLMMVFPLGPGPALLKQLWMPTAELLPAITLTVAAASFVTAATAGLRAMGVARRSLRAQLTGSVAYVICGALGAVLAGAVGTSWGVTVAYAFAALVWWHQLRSALADHHAVPEVAE
jgi:O-antigen/teichoic acid export membrane protein